MNIIDIQALKIPSGWTVDWNTMPTVEPTAENINQFQGSSLIMLHNDHANRMIDIYWRPELDPNGFFYLEVYNRLEVFNEKLFRFDGEVDWEHPFLEFRTRSKADLIRKLEEVLWQLPPFEDPRILKKRGVIDEIAEPLRKQFQKNGLNEYLFQTVMESKNAKLQNLVIDSPAITISMLQELVEHGRNKGVRNKARQKKNTRVRKK